MNKTCTLKSNKSKCLKGIISVPPDKSISQRALILSAICIGNSKIYNLLESEDVLNTLKSIEKLGLKIEKKKMFYEVYGTGGLFKDPQNNLNFGNSGTGLRLMTGLLSTRNINANLIGDSSLSKRPMLRVINPLKKMNVVIEHNNGLLPIKISANNFLSFPIKFRLKIGSAQVKSALLLAATALQGTTEIVEEKPSRDHTELMLKFLGAEINIEKKNNSNTIKIHGPTILRANNFYIPGDVSSAAFLIVATILTKNSKITIKNVGINNYRTGLIDVLKKMNGKISIQNKRTINSEVVADIIVSYSKLKAVQLNESFTTRLIDEYPILFVAASFADGISVFKGLEELKFKESNRIESMQKALKDAGVNINVKSNIVKIKGNQSQNGGNLVQTNKDHRIAMSMLVFGMVSRQPILVDDMKMINTSFPGFKDCLQKIGANIEVVQK